MGEPVTAWMSIGPWDESRVDQEFQAVAEAVAGYLFDDDYVETEHGTVVRCFEAVMANRGSEALAVFPPLVRAAGMWCRVGDEGGYGRDRHNDVYAPDGRVWKTLETGDGVVTLPEPQFRQMCAGVTAEEAIRSVAAYFVTGERRLGEWIAAETG